MNGLEIQSLFKTAMKTSTAREQNLNLPDLKLSLEAQAAFKIYMGGYCRIDERDEAQA
jgi:hypothetical protein